MRRCSVKGVLAGVAVAGVVAACSPVLDWREFQPDGFGLKVAFPCRPDRSARPVAMPGRPAALTLTMLACQAGGQTFALAFADASDPLDATVLLRALRRAALANIGAADAQPAPNPVTGATPVSGSGVVVAEGRLPDGRRVREHLSFFASGLRVYQAVVVGDAPDVEAVATFFGALRPNP